jgi:glycosyltransferase involved in cell wall biosynthesis
MRKRFEEIVVIATTPFTPKILTPWMHPVRRFDSLARDYTKGNVRVFYTKELAFPWDPSRIFRCWHAWIKTERILGRIRFKPDIVHAHFTLPCGAIASRIKKQLIIPSVLTVHEDHDWLQKEEQNALVKKAWNDANALIRVNKLDTPLLQKYNQSVHWIPNGYDENKFKYMSVDECRMKLHLPMDKHICFSLGHMERRKGFHDLVEAAAILWQKRKDFIILIGGDGPDKGQLMSRVKEKGLEDCVRFLGYVADADVPMFMNASDFFVLPSYSEGNPTVMFEALGCGRPYIGCAVGGVPEVITSKELGLLVKPSDVNGLMIALSTAFDKTWNREFIISESKQYTWRTIADSIFNVYTTLVI